MATMEILSHVEGYIDKEKHEYIYAVWTGVCPVCKKVTRFDQKHSGEKFLVSTGRMWGKALTTGGIALGKFILSPATHKIGCVECRHSMAICKNCRIAFSTDPNKTFHQCPSCTKEYV